MEGRRRAGRTVRHCLAGRGPIADEEQRSRCAGCSPWPSWSRRPCWSMRSAGVPAVTAAMQHCWCCSQCGCIAAYPLAKEGGSRARDRFRGAARGLAGVEHVLGKRLGIAAGDRRARRHLFRRVHADRGRRDERRVRVRGRGVRVQGHGTEAGAEGAARLGQHERDAALHHHQRRVVLLSADFGADSAADGRLDDRQGPRGRSVSC